MCGFVGSVYGRPPAAAEIEAHRSAVRRIAHRGPDGEGVRAIPEAGAVLAFRRLAIIDLATGDQPMRADGTHLVFNGEIYNYRTLRGQLEREGVTFRTSSDTEVLQQLLARRGVRGLDEVRGMFAFAFLDPSAGRLILGRDRLGVKQLYYTATTAGIHFASEPKALLAVPGVRAGLDTGRLPAYFAFRCVPAPDTLFQGIAKLPPGVARIYDLRAGRAENVQYWRLPDPTPGSLSEPALPALEASFLTAVDRRLVADVPVGAFLSGGLDSSLIVAAIRRLGHRSVKTFTATFPGSPDDESAFARRVSERFDARNFQAPLQPADFLSELPRWVELNDDLVADASSLPLLRVADVARREGCIVLLSGEGADELFGGYGSYHKYVLLSALAALIPGAVVRERLVWLAKAAGLIAGQDLPRIREYFVRRQRYMGTAALLGQPEMEALLERDTGVGFPLPRAGGGDLAELGAFDFARRIPDDLLVRTDRATMGASVEARVPFLDHDLVELVARLPTAQRGVLGVSKLLLRRLARRWGIPRETILHRKIGFQLPIGEWFRGPLRGAWETVFERRAVPGLRYDGARWLFDAHQRREGRFEEILWRILALEAWYARWVMGDPVFFGETRRRGKEANPRPDRVDSRAGRRGSATTTNPPVPGTASLGSLNHASG